MDPARNLPATAWLGGIEDYLHQHGALMASMMVAMRTATVLARQVRQLATRLEATALPPASIPASPSAAPADGPESRFGAPECFADGSETCGARIVTFPANCAHREWLALERPLPARSSFQTVTSRPDATGTLLAVCQRSVKRNFLR